MSALALDLEDGDNIDFVHAFQPVIVGVLRLIEPPEVYLVKIDSWFGTKWLGFSHKVLGKIAVNRAELRVPPFVPGRVRSQSFFRDSGSTGYQRADSPLQLHIEQPSSDNARRVMSTQCPAAAAFWWSGDTRRNRRGCLMAYLPSHGGHTGWYAEYLLTDRWIVGRTRRTTAQELAGYATTARAA
jgi:hypothetical protein